MSSQLPLELELSVDIGPDIVMGAASEETAPISRYYIIWSNVCSTPTLSRSLVVAPFRLGLV